MKHNIVKQVVKEEIFNKHYNGMIEGFKFSELPTNLEPNDLIVLHVEDSYYSENNSWDAFSELIVYRERLETDQEFEKRKAKLEAKFEESRKERYQHYLKLKKEFETNE